MPPIDTSTRLGLSGALAGSALSRNRMIRNQAPKSAGVLHDQQTLGHTTGNHGHLLLGDWCQPAMHSKDKTGKPALSPTSLLTELPHTSRFWLLADFSHSRIGRGRGSGSPKQPMPPNQHHGQKEQRRNRLVLMEREGPGHGSKPEPPFPSIQPKRTDDKNNQDWPYQNQIMGAMVSQQGE